MTVALVSGSAAYDYMGVSGDTKPVGTPAGAKFYETDTGDTYISTGSSWLLYYGGAVNAADALSTGAVTARDKALAAQMFLWHAVGEIDPVVDAGNFTDAGPGRYHTVTGLMGFNGTTWDRMITAVRALSSGSGLMLATGAFGYDDTGALWRPVRTADVDGKTAAQQHLHVNGLFNGNTVDRERSNLEGSLLASAARTATNSTGDQTNHSSRGVRIWIDVTAIVDTPSITVSIEDKDPVSGTYTAILTSAAITGVSLTRLTVYPGMTPAANVAVSEPLPRTWRVTVTHADADSITYSVGYSLMR